MMLKLLAVQTAAEQGDVKLREGFARVNKLHSSQAHDVPGDCRG
jgi:hypothetical protein